MLLPGAHKFGLRGVHVGIHEASNATKLQHGLGKSRRLEFFLPLISDDSRETNARSIENTAPRHKHKNTQGFQTTTNLLRSLLAVVGLDLSKNGHERIQHRSDRPLDAN